LALISLLLLDLDGVVVYEIAPPHVQKLELVLLHDLLIKALQALGVPVVVLTHRSRAEAAVILKAAGLENAVAGLMAAEDILNAALTYGTPWQLLRRGLRKSWVLPAVERRYRVSRENIAFIDDRLDNIEDLVVSGVGVALHVPSGMNRDGSLISFDFEQAMRLLREWTGDRSPPILSVPTRIVVECDLSRTGISVGRFATSPFNRARGYARSLRQLLWHRRPVQSD
jgi:hypothetical protein